MPLVVGDVVETARRKLRSVVKHQHAGVGHYHPGHLLITVSAILKDTHVTFKTLEDKA